MKKQHEKSFINKATEKYQEFFERNHLAIQIILFAIIVVVEAFFQAQDKVATNNQIFALLLYIAAEIYTLITHFTLIHSKVNQVIIDIKKERGQVFEVNEDYREITDFFDNDSSSLFISGMALNGLFSSFGSSIKNCLLQTDKKVYITLSGIDATESDSEIFFGDRNQKTAVCTYIKTTLTILKNFFSATEFNEYVNSGRLNIAMLGQPITSSLIGNNLMEEESGDSGMVKVLFYCNGLSDPQKCPNIFLRNDSDSKWFKRFKNVAQKQYENAHRIESYAELCAEINRLA